MYQKTLGDWKIDLEAKKKGYDREMAKNPIAAWKVPVTIRQDTSIYPIPSLDRAASGKLNKGEKVEATTISTFQKQPYFVRLFDLGWVRIGDITVPPTSAADFRKLDKTEAASHPLNGQPAAPSPAAANGQQKPSIKLLDAAMSEIGGGILMTAILIGVGAYFVFREK
jgi:hypothetical protein